MPRKVQVGTLKSICTHALLQNMRQYSTAELHDLPGSLIEFVLETAQRDDVPISYKNRLLSSRLTKLDLREWNFGNDVHETLRLICYKNLTVLRVGFCGRATNLVDLMGHVPRITELNLPGCDDDDLEKLGNGCPELKKLTLCYPNVTDSGMVRLCKSNTGGAKIEYFNIRDYDEESTKNLTKCGMMILLEHLESLKVLICDKFVRLMMEWILVNRRSGLRDAADSSNFPKRVQHLTTLKLSFGPIVFLTGEDVSFVRRVCPRLSKLHVRTKLLGTDLHRVVAATATGWTGLTDFLYEAEYQYTAEINARFSLVSPLLTTVGATVTVLELGNLKNVRVLPIGAACPGLTDLTLANVSWSSRVECCARRNDEHDDAAASVPFRNLKTLAVGSFPPHPAMNGLHRTKGETIQIASLLRNCDELKELKISNLKMKSKTFLGILEANPLVNLTEFSMFYCQTLTTAVVTCLLNGENELESLSILGCRLVNEKTVRTVVKNRSYDVKLRYERSHF